MSIYSAVLMVLSVGISLVIGIFTRRFFKKPQEPDTKISETVSDKIKPAEGLFNSLLSESEVVTSRVCTTEDLEITTGEIMYYLVHGSVQILYDNSMVLERTEDYFMYNLNWLINTKQKPRITYKISKNSQLYQIDKTNPTVKYFLLNRFFRGTLYTVVNYLEEGFYLDITRITTGKQTHQEILQEVKNKMEIIKKVEASQEISLTETYEIPPNTLIYILEGSGRIEYTESVSQTYQKGDLIGVLERILPIKCSRIIHPNEKTLGIKIKLQPLLGVPISSLEKVADEIFNRSNSMEHLEITDAMINWRIIQAGERLSSDIPTKSIKCITNGYFLKNSDVKYFGIASKNVLFEKEVLLGQSSSFELTAARLSEVIEIPKEYITKITSSYPALSNAIYRRILERTGVETELKQPSIITFIPNDKKETQLEIFTYFLGSEMERSDSCIILSSSELNMKLKLIQTVKHTIPLLNYISDLQREYSYILIPIVDAVHSKKAKIPEEIEGKERNPVVNQTKKQKNSNSEAEEKEDQVLQDITPIVLSEIIFYVVTNGDHRDIDIKKDIFCKIDTLILHRDSQMKVAGGRYYGQRHNVEFPLIDVPVSVIKTRESINYTNKNCKFNALEDTWIPYFPLNDMHRFIRTLKGTNVGLVLGGGGARGIAHIGIIEALEEANIPIDAVGGTSMGAFVGALYAQRANNKEVFIQAKRLTNLLGSVWRVIVDLTYPICSIFTGKSFNWALRLIFKNRRIEDLWLPYYCITTDIADFEEKKHTDGILWRYVRASMSLSGYLPPLCDNGSFLLDGGYMNNVPADAMRSMGIRNIIAVDVGSEVETTFADYGDSINGFYILMQKIFSTKKFLSLTEIQYRLAYLTSMHKERSLKSDVTIKYIRPDMAGYKTMNFRQFDEIVAHGYQHGKKVIAEWKNTGEYLELTTMTRAPRRI
ncbi:lysophospholipid hydrolase [Nematocida ausubeli]|nr:lysophospholipid hydrolase [Nematocida ausubeli]